MLASLIDCADKSCGGRSAKSCSDLPLLFLLHGVISCHSQPVCSNSAEYSKCCRCSSGHTLVLVSTYNLDALVKCAHAQPLGWLGIALRLQNYKTTGAESGEAIVGIASVTYPHGCQSPLMILDDTRHS